MRSALSEIGLVFLGVCAATVAFTQLSAGFEEYAHLFVAGVFLLVAVKMAQRRGGLRRFGIDLAGLLEPPDDVDPGVFGLRELGRTLRRAMPSAARETLFALAIASIVFPPFVVAFYAWNAPTRPFVLQPSEDFASFALAQLVIVGLPEEALFRGYFQTRLTDVWPKTTRILGAHISVLALVSQAVLFAVLHFVVDLQPERLAVFFPALLFGWVRARRDGIGAAIVLHALSNLLSDLLTRGWL